MESVGAAARDAAHFLASLPHTQKNNALRDMAKAIRAHHSDIQQANEQDNIAAKNKNISAALLDRLKLDVVRIEAMAKGLESIAELPDPVGRILAENTRPNGLLIVRISVPIGVIGVIYESRPNVTVDAAGLCLKSGNAVILRGGSDSFHSSMAIMKALHEGLSHAGIPLAAVQMIETPDRKAVDEMLAMDRYIDVIIPRGGQQLIQYTMEKTRIPVFKHLAGMCHTYIHASADKEMARRIVLNAKMRRTGICGATEVLLVDRTVKESILPVIIDDLVRAGCEVRSDREIQILNPAVTLAGDADYDTEFLDSIISIKLVDDLSAAMEHIAKHGTQHTDAIIADDLVAAKRFLNEVDSAIVMHNTSTQFADGGEFGMGAEIGIATGKLHARGPVGVEQLTTFKYQVRGSGQVRA